jgi:cobalt-zinc-cadmium efflux system outer membrane protein
MATPIRGAAAVRSPRNPNVNRAPRLCRCVVACLAALATATAGAQQDAWSQPSSPILEFPDLGPIRGTTEPPPLPGSLAPAMDLGPSATTPGVLGGKRRTGLLPRGTPRGLASSAVAARGLTLPESLPAPPVAAAEAEGGMMVDRSIIDDPGPPDGLTLDEALDRMLAANLDIRALRHEITQADADILTAGLRTNPLIYMDSQFIPYGSFNDQRPGGPTQYDLNITLPLDVSGKRQSRTVVARMARSTLEAQFQDVTRRQIDNLYRAFVNLQSARIDRLAAMATLQRQEQRLAELERRAGEGADHIRDAIDHLAFTVERSRNAADEATEAFEDARDGLGMLLALPPDDVARLEPQGSLRAAVPEPPGLAELESLALRCRPDLRAARLGVDRAGAEVALQRANRIDDVFLFYDPITIQDNSAYNRQSASSWAVGLTFALPIFNRNQGNIARAESNVGQSRLEMTSLERRALAEVRLAEREYHRSRDAIAHIERAILPRAEALLARRREQFAAGSLTIDDYEGAVEDLAEVTQAHRDALVRHRRAMLTVNTAVGLRIIP